MSGIEWDHCKQVGVNFLMMSIKTKSKQMTVNRSNLLTINLSFQSK